MRNIKSGRPDKKGWNMDKTEQWLHEGDCDICRRRNYCNKTCKPARQMEQVRMSRLVSSVALSAISKALKEG